MTPAITIRIKIRTTARQSIVDKNAPIGDGIGQ